MIGFLPMLAEIGYSLWVYSCFLTLREWSVISYCTCLAFGLVFGIMNLFDYANIKILFYLLNEIFYAFALYYTVNAYKDFRFSGGIHGTNGKVEKKSFKNRTIEDRLIDKGI